MGETEHDGSPAMLNGWKEIAAFLGKSVRSVQRWERDLGLPVRRINTPDHGQIVYASRAEIEEWRRRMDRRSESLDDGEARSSDPERHTEWAPAVLPPPASQPVGPIPDDSPSQPATRSLASPKTRRAIYAASILAALVGGLLLGRWTIVRETGPEHVELSGSAVQAIGLSGRVLWRYDFGQPIGRPDASGGDVSQVDLDGDGSPEFVVPVRYGSQLTRRPARSDEVFCFRRDGTLLWRATPQLQMTQGGRTFQGPWYFRGLVSPGAPASGRSWIAFSHHTSNPGVVLEKDPDGQERLRFVQDGWVTSLAYWPSARGPMLAAGGINNGMERAAIALVPANGPPAQAPTTSDRRLVCGGCPSEGPAAYFLIPTSEVAVAGGAAYSQVSELSITDAGLRVSTDDSQIGLISPVLEFDALDFADDYWAAHRLLEEDKKIDHSTDKCRALSAPREVTSWRPDSGWETERVKLTPGGSCP